MALKLTRCSTCDSRRIKKVRRHWKDTYKGQTYVVPNLEFYECPDCGERLFDRDAMRKIEAHSPAFPKPRTAAAR